MSIFTKIEGEFVEVENWAALEWQKLDKEAKKLVPVAINILTEVNSIMQSPVPDAFAAILNVVTNGADATLIAKIESTVRVFLPEAITGLTLVNSIANITDPEAQFLAILAQLKLSNKATQDAYLHDLSAMILKDLVEGMTWGKAVQICQYYYDNRDKLTQAA